MSTGEPPSEWIQLFDHQADFGRVRGVSPRLIGKLYPSRRPNPGA
jgi:hypothetical protein